MINIETITSKMLGLVGWRQSIEPNAASIGDMTESRSGIYVTDEHPLFKQEILEAVAPDYSRITWPAWSGLTTYTAGAIVTHSGSRWEAKRSSLNKTPGTSPDDWQLYIPFMEWLKEKTQAGISRAVMAWAAAKQIDRTARTLIEDTYLFRGGGQIKDVIPYSAEQCGFEIEIYKGKGVTVDLLTVGIQFATNCTFTLYLYQEGKQAAIKSKEIVYQGAGAVVWYALDWSIGQDQQQSGGRYYILYDRATAPDSINRGLDWANPVPCGWCGRDEFINWEAMQKTVRFWPVSVNGTPGTLPDMDGNQYQHFYNYGLNFQIRVRCDLTAFVLRNENFFAPLISKQIAIDLLREIVYNPSDRINKKAGNIRSELLTYEIDGDPRGRATGKITEYVKALEAINISTEGLDEACLPCKRSGIRIKHI